MARGCWLCARVLPALLVGLAGALALRADALAPFSEEAASRGVAYAMQSYPQATGYLGFAAGFADLDADGDPDIVLLGAADGHVGLFENDGAGQFTDRSAGSGIPLLAEPSGFLAFDYDADGDLDLHLSQQGIADVLMRNDGGFAFTDVTATAQVADVGASKSASAADFDGDGWLDFYVAKYNGIPSGTEDNDNALYRNLGDGGFSDVSVAQTVDDFGRGFQSVWTDYDRDGDVDLYLSNDRGHLAPLFRGNQLWRNDAGQLVNVSVGSGANGQLFSMGIASGDFDGNRWPDLYVTNIGGYAEGFNPLYLNQGNGTFVESSAAAGVDQYITSWGAIFFDFDNDGHQDLYVNNMFVSNALYDCDGAFPCSEIGAAAAVTASADTSFSSAIADVDADGDLDLLVNNVGGAAQLFINHEGETRSWIKYRIVGSHPNLWAIGANVDTRVGSVWRLREVLAGGNGYLGQNELTRHVGLGAATQADEVVVKWPGGAPTRTLTNLPANQTWSLYPPERLGDADASGGVDLADFVSFAACYEVPFAPGCELHDFDGDSEVAPDDFAAFLGVFDGPPPDCDTDGTPDMQEILLDPGLDANGDGWLDACGPAVPLLPRGGLPPLALLLMMMPLLVVRGRRRTMGAGLWLCLLAAAVAAALPQRARAVLPFTEEAAARGVVYTVQPIPQVHGYHGFGTGFADLDADGDPDIVILGAADGRVGLFENTGAGSFADRSLASGLPLLAQASGFAAADYDGDGDLDLYLAQFGAANLLARNDGGFQFTIVTGLGVGDTGAGKSASFGDYDGDGWLDLYLANYSDILPPQDDTPNRLYRNVGGAGFTEEGAAQTVDDVGEGFQAVWTDFDRDGDVDLYLSNDNRFAPLRPNQLWRNDAGQLVNVSAGSGADVGIYSMGVASGDFDGNGWPDLYVTNLVGGYGINNPLLLNQGNGTFVESGAAAGVDNPFTSWGSIFFDFDNDGHQDLYVNNMWQPNTLYDCDGAFPCAEIGASAAVVASTQPSYSSAIADVDDDGDLDLLLNNLGGAAQLFINHEGETRSWIKYRIVGSHPNLWAIGANVDTRVGSVWRLREVLAGGNGYLGQNELTRHVGLGAATQADEVVVKWPGGAPTRTLTNLPANQTWSLYPPERLGDADASGGVDLADFVSFAACYEVPFAPGCELHDFDGDSDVAPDDFTAFLGVFDGPPPDCDTDGTPDMQEILLDPGLDANGDGWLDACGPAVPALPSAALALLAGLLLSAAFSHRSRPGPW